METLRADVEVTQTDKDKENLSSVSAANRKIPTLGEKTDNAGNEVYRVSRIIR